MKLICVIAVMVVFTLVIVYWVNQSKNTSEYKQSLKGTIVDVVDNSHFVVYTEDLQTGYEILSIHVTENTITDSKQFQINQSVHVTYSESIADLSPPFLKADEITLNQNPEKDLLNKATEFYTHYNARTGFRRD